MPSKKELSEQEIRSQYIYSALIRAGWNPQSQIGEAVSLTDGRIYVKGRLTTRGSKKQADYILYYKPNIPVAVIEAKRNTYSVQAGIQQALLSGNSALMPSLRRKLPGNATKSIKASAARQRNALPGRTISLMAAETLVITSRLQSTGPWKQLPRDSSASS